jgi:hypothetical protein
MVMAPQYFTHGVRLEILYYSIRFMPPSLRKYHLNNF